MSSFQTSQIIPQLVQYHEPAYLEAISPTAIKMRAFMLGAVASLVTMQLDDRANPLLHKRLVTEFQPADFRALIGERFHIQSHDGLLTIATLDAVNEQRNDVPACYALFFRNPLGAKIVESTYTFAHTQLGIFDLPVSVSTLPSASGRFVAQVVR